VEDVWATSTIYDYLTYPDLRSAYLIKYDKTILILILSDLHIIMVMGMNRDIRNVASQYPAIINIPDHRSAQIIDLPLLWEPYIMMSNY
jgi:hypothetical protein